MHVAVRLCYRRPHTGSGSLARSVSQSVCLLVGTRLLGLVSEVPRRTYAGPPIAHPAYDAAASRKTAAGGLAVGTQTRRRSIVPSCAQTRSSARCAPRTHGYPRLSLSVHCVCGLGVFEANETLSQRYHTHGITLATPHPVWTSHPSAMSLRFVRLHAPRKVERLEGLARWEGSVKDRRANIEFHCLRE